VQCSQIWYFKERLRKTAWCVSNAAGQFMKWSEKIRIENGWEARSYNIYKKAINVTTLNV